MKTTTSLFIAASFMTFLSCSNAEKEHASAAPADTAMAAAPEQIKEEKAPLDSASAAKAWESYMTPGDMHKMLEAMNGKWTSEMIYWEGPDAKPSEKSMASVENKMVLGGRYQEGIFKGNMEGMPFEGHSTMAYDNAKKIFINTWFDNMGTGVVVMTGTLDEATKTIKMAGSGYDPTTGQDCDMRQEYQVVDDKNHIMTMYSYKDGKEYKSMESKLTKK